MEVECFFGKKKHLQGHFLDLTSSGSRCSRFVLINFANESAHCGQKRNMCKGIGHGWKYVEILSPSIEGGAFPIGCDIQNLWPFLGQNMDHQ